MPTPTKSTKKSAPAKTIAGKTAVKNPKNDPNQAVVLSSKVSYKGHVFSVTTDKVTEPGGVTSTRDVIRHNGSVVILAVDSSQNPADPTILIERQYRHAAGQFLLELPAGRIEPGEAPLAAAKRELIEETGFRAKNGRGSSATTPAPAFLPKPCRSS
jgi:ADP-ribose pyrophosphatase